MIGGRAADYTAANDDDACLRWNLCGITHVIQAHIQVYVWRPRPADHTIGDDRDESDAHAGNDAADAENQ